MKWLKIVSTVFFFFILVGCGTQVALSGKARTEYLKSIKPYITYWEKVGMTELERRQDWVVCGGQANGNFGFEVERHQLPGETGVDTETRVEHEFQRCMLRAGYHYTGNCTSEYMKSRPLCGAP